MIRVPKAIASAQLTTAAVTYYTAPAGTVGTINNLSFTNTSGSPQAVTMYRVPSGGSPSAANQFSAPYTIPVGQTYVPPAAIGLQLDAGMTLQVLAAANTAVTIMGGVYETSGS
jgi:hypothetical protein